MDSLLKLDQWTLALFLGICFLLLFMLIFKFKLVSNVIAENFAESCGYGAPNHNH
jgi:Na+-transporting methylmalonyl-CoA/oxaloacetate decarboxylase gamma subunit